MDTQEALFRIRFAQWLVAWLIFHLAVAAAGLVDDAP
jgi:hypothetical protein